MNAEYFKPGDKRGAWFSYLIIKWKHKKEKKKRKSKRVRVRDDEKYAKMNCEASMEKLLFLFFLND
jgi:hypothetical protein